MSTPRQGIHKPRIPIIDLALVDVVGTFFIGKYIQNNSDYSFWQSQGIAFGSGILVHKLLNINTELNNKLGI